MSARSCGHAVVHCEPMQPRWIRRNPGGSASPTKSSPRSTRGGLDPRPVDRRHPITGRTRNRHVRRHTRTGLAVTTVQYRVAHGKKDEAVEGSDDADVVVTIAAADAGLDPTVAFMQ